MSVIRHGDERFECPNGHQISGDFFVECDECDAVVAYVPLAVEIRLTEQLQGTVESARDADAASMQAAFWRARAIELGADPDEWKRHDAATFGGQ
jgi:hypothetical protein